MNNFIITIQLYISVKLQIGQAIFQLGQIFLKLKFVNIFKKAKQIYLIQF